MSESNYFDPGGTDGVCTNCGRDGRLRLYPGTARDYCCERCRRRDSRFVGAFLLFMYVLIPAVVVAGLLI
jgi:hypothetical protein